MKEEEIKRLEDAHHSRRRMYHVQAPMEGRQKEIHEEARRRLLKMRGPNLRLIQTEGEQ